MIFEKITGECDFRFSRSSGKGGQNVNKVETKVELIFKIDLSEGLNEEEKGVLIGKLNSKLNKQGELIIVSEKSRSQFRNKEDVLLKLKKTLESALRLNKKRTTTKIPKAVRERILKKKKIQSEKKENRKKIRP